MPALAFNGELEGSAPLAFLRLTANAKQGDDDEAARVAFDSSFRNQRPPRILTGLDKFWKTRGTQWEYAESREVGIAKLPAGWYYSTIHCTHRIRHSVSYNTDICHRWQCIMHCRKRLIPVVSTYDETIYSMVCVMQGICLPLGNTKWQVPSWYRAFFFTFKTVIEHSCCAALT